MPGVAGWYYGHYVYRALNVLCKFVFFQNSCEYSCHVFCHAANRTGKYGKSCIMAIIYISCFVAEFNRIRAAGETDGAGMPDHPAYDKYSVRNSCGIPYENGRFCSVKGGVR